MNLRSTLLLSLLTATGAFVWWNWERVSSWAGLKESAATVDAVGTRVVVPTLTPNSIQRVELTNVHGSFTLQKDMSGRWALPGNWPTRQAEAQSLIDLLTHLETRFAPIPLDSPAENLREFGLDPSQQPVTVLVATGGESVRLVFGEPSTRGDGPLARPTYVRVNDGPEVFRLGPDLLRVLRRPREFYQRRQLFPEADRVRFAESRSSNPFAPAAEGGSGSVLIPRGQQIAIQGPQGRIVLRASHRETSTSDPRVTTVTTPEFLAEQWEIVEPVSDRADPEKLKNLLSAVPNLWVESFSPAVPPTLYPAVLSFMLGDHWATLLAPLRLALEPSDSAWVLQQVGLNPPEYQVTLTRPSGDVATLHLGRICRVAERPGTPPPSRPGMPPLPPLPVREEYRYARLEGQPLLFEVKADKLADLFPSLATLRDARLARFQASDAVELQIRTGQETIILQRDKADKSSDKWRINQPLSAIAENSKVTELLDKLAGLESRDKDVLDSADLKKAGLESAAVQVTVHVEEEIPSATPGDKKEKRKRAITFEFGAKDGESNKVHVRVAGQKRVNLIEESAFSLASRSALAYRGRRILDFDTSKVARIEVKRSSETFVLQQQEREWKLTAPVVAPAERFKASDLASDLGRLEAVEYIDDQPTPERLSTYGLDQPPLTIQVTLADSSEPQVLFVGKQREMQPEFFAKLATSPSVFVIRKDLRDRLDQDSLSYRVKDLWSLIADDMTQLTIERGTDRIEMRRDSGAWRITQPFDALANQTEIRPILDSLASLRIEGYEVHTTDKLEDYGLHQPALRLSFTATERKGDAPPTTRTWTLLLGKAVPGKSEIYAKRDDDPAIFRITDPLLRQAGRSALDLLDRRVLSVERRRVQKFERSGSANWMATREGESWKIQAGDQSFAADQPTIDATLRAVESLLADRVAAYGPQIKLEEFGLQSPVDSLTIVLSSDSAGAAGGKHVLRFGKEADGGGRYVAADDSKSVFVVSAALARELTRGHLDYADRTLLKLDGAPIQSIRRVMKNNDLELTRSGGWKITKPVEFTADEAILDDLTKTLSTWRANRVAAYQASDLRPFGLDEPTALVTIEHGEPGKTSQRIVKVGGPVDPMTPTGERYVMVEASPIVGVVDSVMAKRLLAEPIAFRDRQLVRRLPEPDKVTLQRGERRVTFVKSQGTWRMTEPTSADAEHADLEEFVNSLFRLRADELVAEKPTPEKLNEFGLDSPSAVWRFYSADKEVLALVLGKRDSTDQRVYARLGEGDIVFLLTPAVTTRATAEYRKRAILPSFDAAQVETLTLAGESGEVVLRKVDGAWKIDGQADTSVKQQAVTDILGALASLKAQEFVRDLDAPREIYGLSPPKRRIVARTNSGQTAELWLGNLQGGSKRAYACLPTGGDVFTLSEADTGKLLAQVK